MDQPQTFAKRYVERAVLGEGGMGTVYRVSDQLIDGPDVALKTIKHSGVVTADQRLRFKEEFRAMARLRHPNTIEVLDFGQLDETSLFITMELVPGRELTDVMAGRQMPVAEIYPLVIQLLQALYFVHSRHYVHRDIKSQNIRVRDDGRLKLMDFGLMGRLGQPSSRTVTGSPGYLAPEVAIGGRIDASSDLYSVGCLMFEMITGRLPFEGTLGKVVRGHISEKPPDIKVLRPDVPDRLERIVLRLLEKEQARRYRSAADVIEDLAALAGMAIADEDLDQRRSYLTTSVIVGRDAELNELETALKRSLAGTSQAILVAAPAGTGKSRLVQELLLQAKLNEVLVLHGQCIESGMAPYEALTLALRPGLAHGTLEEKLRHHAALDRLYPSFVDDVPPTAQPLSAEDLANATLEWLQSLSIRMPLLLLMDDLHWADPQTLAVFNHLVRNMGDHRVMCVGTFRNDETPASSPVWYTLEERTSRGLTLGPLSYDAQMTLLDAMLQNTIISEDFARALYRATGGNAFFLTEVLRALMEDGLLVRHAGQWIFPVEAAALSHLTSVEKTLQRRLGHLSRPARRIANLAAVLGPKQTLAELRAVTAGDEDELLEALEELFERQFLLKFEEHYAFPHDRVREVLYEQMDPTIRSSLHQRAGEYLESHPNRDPAHHTHELAYHFGHGRDAGKAYHYLLAAANQADETGADGIALDLWVQAEAALAKAELPNKVILQCELWLEIARNGFVMRPDDAIGCLKKIVQTVESWPGPPDEIQAFGLVHIYGLMAISMGFAGLPREALQAVDRAAKLATPTAPEELGAMAFMRCGALLAAGQIDAACAGGKVAEDFLKQVSTAEAAAYVRGPMVGCLSIQNVNAFQGYRPSTEIRDRALAASRANRDENPFTVLMPFGIHAAYAGRLDDIVAYLEQTVQKSRRASALPYPFMLFVRAHLLWQKGGFAGALTMADQALTYPHVRQQRLAVHLLLNLRAQTLVDLGRIDEGEAAFDALLAEAEERGMGFTQLLARVGLGYAAIARKDAKSARPPLELAFRASEEGVLRNPYIQIQAGRLLARVHLVEGDTARAKNLGAEGLAMAERPEIDLPLEQAHSLLLLADVAWAAADREAATASLRRAGEIFHQFKNTHWLHVVTARLEELHDLTLVVPPPPMAASIEVVVDARWKFLRGAMM